MIGDARNVVHGTTIEADLCIVGAGAAGITVALELLGSGMRIVLLEAGGHDGRSRGPGDLRRRSRRPLAA